MPLTPTQIIHITDLITERLSGADLHINKSSTNGTRNVTTKKATVGLTGDPANIIEALLSLIKPTERHLIHPDLKDKINDIKEILDHPEEYVENPANYKQFKGIIRDEIQAEIDKLRTLSPEEKQRLKAEQEALRKEAKETKERVAKAQAPEAGDPRATLMLSDAEYYQLHVENIRREEAALNVLNNHILYNDIIGTNPALLDLIISDINVRNLVNKRIISFSKLKELYEASPDKLQALAHPNILSLARTGMPFSKLEALYDASEDKIYLITLPGVMQLIREEFITWSKAEQLCYTTPDKLDFLAHHNLIKFMKDFDIDFDRASRMYDESRDKLEAISHPFTQQLMINCHISLDQAAYIYDESPRKLRIISNSSTQHLICLAGFERIEAVYNCNPRLLIEMARNHLHFSASTLTVRCDEILAQRDINNESGIVTRVNLRPRTSSNHPEDERTVNNPRTEDRARSFANRHEPRRRDITDTAPEESTPQAARFSNRYAPRQRHRS